MTRGLMALLLLGAIAADEGGMEAPRLADIKVDRDQDGVYVSMRVDGAFSKPLREALDSGVPVTFRYVVKVTRARSFWLDRTLVAGRIETSAKLDVLSREYRLSRSMDGMVLEARSTASASEAMDHLARLQRVRISSPAALEAGVPCTLWARAKVSDAFVLYVIPSAVQTGWASVALGGEAAR